MFINQLGKPTHASPQGEIETRPSLLNLGASALPLQQSNTVQFRAIMLYERLNFLLSQSRMIMKRKRREWSITPKFPFKTEV